jgi:hypothetical protein
VPSNRGARNAISTCCHRPGARLAVWLGARYLLLGAGAYALVRFSTISLPAALAGLFVSVAAVIVEILFQLVYARV